MAASADWLGIEEPKYTVISSHFVALLHGMIDLLTFG